CAHGAHTSTFHAVDAQPFALSAHTRVPTLEYTHRSAHTGVPTTAARSAQPGRPTRTCPPGPMRVGYTATATPGASRQVPSSRANACLLIGDCTTGRPPRSPTSPREST